MLPQQCDLTVTDMMGFEVVVVWDMVFCGILMAVLEERHASIIEAG